MLDKENSFLLFLSIDLLIPNRPLNIRLARRTLERSRLKSSAFFSQRCHLAQELSTLFLDDSLPENGLSKSLIEHLNINQPSLDIVALFTPALLSQRDNDLCLERIGRIFKSLPDASPMNHASVIMMGQLYRGLQNQLSQEEISKTLALPSADETLMPKWWWILQQSLHILFDYSSKPALEFINQSLNPQVPLTMASLSHPLWGLPYLYTIASKSTVLQDLEQVTPHLSPGVAEVLGVMMSLYSPELFPPSWLKKAAKRRWDNQTTAKVDNQLRLFDD